MDEGYEGERLHEHQGKGGFIRKWIASNRPCPGSFCTTLIHRQDAKAKEDRENLVARNRMVSVRNLGYLLDGMRTRRVLYLLFLWKQLCNETKLEENCEARIRDAESRSAASLSELTSRVQSLIEEAEKKEEEHRATLYKARSDASLRAIESVLALQRRAKLEQAFMQWMRVSKQEQFAERTAAFEKQLAEANATIERVWVLQSDDL